MKKIFLLFFLGLFLTNHITAQEKFKKTIKINGRIQYDYEFLKREKSDDWFNGNEFRRLQLSASGKISPNIKYKVEASFAHGKIGFRDVYIKYLAGKWGNFYLGSVAEPSGLEVLTSSKYIPFFERAMLSSLQNFKWGSGLHYENFNLLDGKASLQLALTNNGNNSEGFKDSHLEKGNNFVGRISISPLKKETGIIHLGLNYAHRPAKDLKFRPENHMGEKYHYEFPGARHRNEMGFEWAGTYQNISLQGEYKIQDLDNKLNKNYQMSGYYIMGSYFITGEQRPYKHSAFGRVKPKKDIDNGGMGAWEILLRYSNMTATKDIIDNNPGLPGQINNISFGLNWYLTSHARIMYNYVITDDQNKILGNLSGHLIRAQVDF